MIPDPATASVREEKDDNRYLSRKQGRRYGKMYELNDSLFLVTTSFPDYYSKRRFKRYSILSTTTSP